MCLYNDVFIHIRCFLFMLLLCFLCYIILCCVIHFLHIYFFRRCAKTIISLIYSLPYRCANGPFINIALTPVYFTKLAAVYLRCLEKQQQQIKSKNINVEGVICQGVVLFLFVIWVSVFTFHIFEDHAAKHDMDSKSGNKFKDD